MKCQKKNNSYNNRKNLFFVTCILFIIVTGVGMSGRIVMASSATITFSIANREVQKGDDLSVVVSLDSSDIIGDFEAYVSYDPEILEFTTGGSHVSGGSGLLKISDLNSDIQSESKKYSIQFKAIKVGNCEIAVSDTPGVYNADGDEMSVSRSRLTISVVSSEKLSDNSSLSSLEVSPGTLTPEFQKDRFKYQVEIPNASERLFLSAIPEDQDAVVEIQGNQELKEGVNFVHVIVTAPSGDKQDYQIEVRRLSVEEENGEEGDVELPQDESGVVYELDGTVYLQNQSKYKLAELDDSTEIPAGYVQSSVTINEIEIEAFLLKNDMESEFFLLFLENDFGEKRFYQMDRIEKTIQRYSQNDGTGENQESDSLDSITKSEYQKRMTAMVFALAVLGVICIILTITLVIKSMHTYKEEE
ncbi:cohesin domain-containing protein [Anaeromicropila populeti]|uniref:Cadherin-like beta sandwich domain-containing protein n=1 Tax=Anaeromicropila populeti TaxID=37658 RepID=A0A1I6IRQ6_9FIRM|nr:cohesin domain-containing protein [Anaeromicropila populeti]SFR69424.1 Cadherin-like beta sandwich domain-containing protein [Anaeromicropila populeti]